MNNFYHRDESRYMHPDVVENHEANISGGENRFLYDPREPYEERRNAVLHIGDWLDPSMLPPRTERTELFEIEEPCSEALPKVGKITFELTVPSAYEPSRRYPVLIDIPGGALFSSFWQTCNPEKYSDLFDAVFVTPRYRHAYDDDGLYPAAIDDLQAIYCYLMGHEKELGVDMDDVVLYGISSGAHLALALAHRLKGIGICPRGIVANEPIVDERGVSYSSHYQTAGWSGWQLYQSSRIWLGSSVIPQEVPAEAFPNHATVDECVGLPPTSIYIGDGDPSVSDVLEYVSKLIQAGVFTSLRVAGGWTHDCNIADNPYHTRYYQQMIDDVRDFFLHDLRRPWSVTETCE